MRIVSTGATLASEKFLEKKRRIRKKKILLVLFLILIFFVFLFFVLRNDRLRIREFAVSGNEVINAEDIIASVTRSLSGWYFYLIPRDSVLLYPKSAMIEELSRHYPRISYAGASLDGIRKLAITVSERKPYALYCPKSSESCYFLDREGFIFDQAPVFSEGVYFTYLSDMEGDPRGKSLMSSDEFRELSQFVENLEFLGAEPFSLTLSDYQRILKISGNAEIIWSHDNDLYLIFSNLESFIRDRGDDFWEKILEVDLRTEDKVFYKFK